jgi:hypothetical protein
MLIAATIVLTFASLARGQAVPFYYAAATIAEPEISVATSGSDLEVQRAVVSHDHKYVTLDLSTSNSSLLGFHTFSFQTGALGFVGSSTAVAGLTPGQNRLSSSLSPPARNRLTPSIAASPTEIALTLNVLDKPGMTLIAPLAGAVDVRK